MNIIDMSRKMVYIVECREIEVDELATRTDTICHAASTLERARTWCMLNLDHAGYKPDRYRWWWFAIVEVRVDGEYANYREPDTGQGLVEVISWNGRILEDQPVQGYDLMSLQVTT